MKTTLKSFYGQIEDENINKIVDIGFKQSLKVINI